MLKRAALPLALGLPLLLGACAPINSLLASRDGEKGPLQFGPLAVGQTWTLGGVLEGRNVVTTIAIPDLVNVQDRFASYSARDQYTGFNDNRTGFAVATYDPGRRNVEFRWVGDAGTASFDRVVYTCKLDRLIGNPLIGTLTYQRNGQVQANGTCEANLSQQS
ncbi:hypothetical protein [Deinococcus arenicola]|uniref:Lipoprotein n=1 Tax=Deinococcus arenicola TaxID=2994950 RepID=A0ABU4DMY4_9DEIO|nr:hypothetical protein [Deinococcus sp. ZS9-10]MDV6373797.1 hypothetical protein [Deinococcus sp. ZS9-10]